MLTAVRLGSLTLGTMAQEIGSMVVVATVGWARLKQSAGRPSSEECVFGDGRRSPVSDWPENDQKLGKMLSGVVMSLAASHSEGRGGIKISASARGS